jgi:hypothetical protein
VSKTRTRDDSFGGTSSTGSPSAISRWAMSRLDAVTAADRPDPVAVSATYSQHLLVAVGVGAETAPGQDPLPFVDGLDRGRSIVRIHPDHHTTHALIPPGGCTPA